jgi:hypothetical protein
MRFPKGQIAKFVTMRHADQESQLNPQLSNDPLVKL